MIYKYLTEHAEQAKAITEILIRFGVDYTIDKSYIIVAKFGGHQYFAMSDSIDYLIDSVSSYFFNDDFDGRIYRINLKNAIPISCSGEFNVKNWDKDAE